MGIRLGLESVVRESLVGLGRLLGPGRLLQSVVGLAFLSAGDHQQ